MPWPSGPFPIRGSGSLDEQNTSTKVTQVSRERWPQGTEETILPSPALQPAPGEKASPPSSSSLAFPLDVQKLESRQTAQGSPRAAPRLRRQDNRFLPLWFSNRSQTTRSEMTISEQRTHSPALSPQLEHLSNSGPVIETTKSDVGGALGAEAGGGGSGAREPLLTTLRF